MRKITYWPKTGSSTQRIVLWLRKNPNVALTAEQIMKKFDVHPSQVSYQHDAHHPDPRAGRAD